MSKTVYDKVFVKEEQAKRETKKPNKETKRGGEANQYLRTNREAKRDTPPNIEITCH